MTDYAAERKVRVRWHLGEPKGAYQPGTPPRLSIQLGMTDAETRSTLAHELAHLDRGDACGEDAVAEERAWEIAAERLVDPEDYAVAEVMFGPAPQKIAAELNVTQHVIDVWRTLTTRRRNHELSSLNRP